MLSQPLRILVITSRPLVDPNGKPIVLLDVAEERRRIRDALNLTPSPSPERRGETAVHVHFLPEATTGAVNDTLAEAWDVVHITGHGAPDGRLWFEDEFGVGQLVDARDLVRMFGKHLPRVVVLSLCFSGRQAPEHLLNAGVGAVVAIQADVPIADRAATLFNQQFYASLARGETIADAFSRAQTRVALDRLVGDEHPPLDDADKPQSPWSKRFTLLGNRAVAFAGRAREGSYAETGVTDRVNGNLRERNSNFVGRANEIVEIVKLFDLNKSRRVAIWGSGGLGKTELSRAVAWWYAERARVDAVLWASASRDEGEYVLRDLASLLSIAKRAFNLSLSEQMPFDQQKAVVREFFASQRSALIILDNWETIEPAHRKEIWDFVLNLSERTRVLVTSRDVLPAKDASNFELDTLTIQDGAALFLNIAHNAEYFKRNPKLSREEYTILNAIIERLGGYPLAVEVVAGQTESRTLEEIWNDLVKFPENVLQGKDELTNEPRGVWTSLGFSYDVLPEPEKAMFRMMGVFLAPASVEDIAAITQVENPREKLDTLVRRSLVRMREGAYALLPIVRDYAESKLKDAGQDPRELHRRAATYYDEKKTIEGQLTASDHLFELAARLGSRDAAEAFVKYVGDFYDDLVTHGYWAEARRKNEQMILVAHALGDKREEAQTIGEQGSMLYRIGEYERAAELHQQALKLLAESGDKRGVAGVLHLMGMLAGGQGNYSEAMRLYDESMKIAEALGDKSEMAKLMHQMGNVAYLQGNYGEAMRLYGESMKIEEVLGNKSGIAITLHQMGMLTGDQGNYSEAMRLYDESMKIDEALGDKSGMAKLMHQMGNVAHLQGSYDEAMRLYGESMKIDEALGDKSGIAISLGQMGKILHDQGQMKEALGYLVKSFLIFDELKTPNRELVGKWIAEIRETVGDEEFRKLMKELGVELKE